MNNCGSDSKGLTRAGDILEQNFAALTPQETPNVQPPAKPTEFANTQLSSSRAFCAIRRKRGSAFRMPSISGIVSRATP